jgi:oxygen-independent coproporphyrinogen-3 oxidase
MSAESLALPDRRRLSVSADDAAGFGIYVHWPFCLSKCPYCDFNSHVREHIDHSRWQKALLAELDHYAERTPKRIVSSVFFGGGTPSLMAPETVAAVIERVKQHWPNRSDLEITLEANPTSAESARFAAYAAAGVTRLSLGVQALDDAALKFLGRRHSAAEALAAVTLARHHFPRTSFDLIYARPEQTIPEWRAELGRALDLADAHLSAYQLAIEPGTVFEQRHTRGDFTIPEDEIAAALYEETQHMLEAAGYAAYEISNFAKPGNESQHNLNYWRYGDYLGVGPGAHGRLTVDKVKHATRQHRVPEAWLADVERRGHATRTDQPLSSREVIEEVTMMGLRLAEGIDRERFAHVTGFTLEVAFNRERLRRLLAGGFLALDSRGLRASVAGRQRLNAVLAELLA